MNVASAKKTGFIFLLIFLHAGISAQEGVETLLFPDVNENILYIEGESAVSTNFALEPTLNYGASGSRTLQLNRLQGLQGNSPFFAEYVFYVDNPGTYRFWYGGTPPGPESDLLASYTSPVTIVLDDNPAKTLYREQTHSREQYLPTLYWNETDSMVELSEGVHTIRFEITEKRRFDGQYFFYLDSFFFVRDESIENPGTPIPKVFPASLIQKSEITFQTIPEYENRIAAAPEEAEAYLSLSYIYSLLGDYLNALTILRQLRLLYPENPDYLILSAKNRIWKGDIQDGLRLYQQALAIAPQRKDSWNEAGKLAAWTGRYQESIQIYSKGLEYHPDDISLQVNLGLTYLWKSEDSEAEIYFTQASEAAHTSLDSELLLGKIYRINGYPLRAEKQYIQAIKRYPLALELYLELIDLYNSEGMDEKGVEVFQTIQDTMPVSGRLSSYLQIFRTKQNLRGEAINEYRQKVAEEPDNIDLRQMLVQTYFWNGKRKEAITEYLNILTNYAYKAVNEFTKEAGEIFKTIDAAYLYSGYYKRFSSSMEERMREISSLIRELSAAEKQYFALQKKEGSPKADLTAARNKVAEIQKMTGEAIARAQNSIDRAAALQYAYDDTVKDINIFTNTEEDDAKRYDSVFKQTEWSWDQRFHIEELEKTLQTEPQLSGHVLATINKIEGKLQPAEQLYNRSIGAGTILGAAAAGLFENSLWQGNWNKADQQLNTNGETIRSYADYFTPVIDLFKELQTEEEVFTIVPTTEEIGRLYNDLTTANSELNPVINDLIRRINTDIETLQDILYNRMVRKFYSLETNTYLLRYELGKFYIAEEQYIDATRQLQKVLVIDPWNMDAKFRLGVVRQQYGDWKGAMQKYRDIYNQDPSYPNAAAYYNLLARQHPDTFSIDTQLLGDTARISLTADMSFSTSITTALSWEGSYKFKGIRLYKTYGDEEPSSHQIHYTELRFPIDLYFINLTISPGAGLYFSSDLFRENSLSTSESALKMGYFLTLWDVHPAFSGELIFAPENLGITASYSWEPVEETFVPERTLLRQHNISLNGYASLAGLDIPFFKYSSARLNGSLRFIEDKNIIGTAMEEFSLGIHLADVPWTTLIIHELVSFEHSKAPSWITDNGYYAPDSVLLLKGGLIGSSWISIMNQNVLGIILSAHAGAYWEKLTASVPDPAALQLEFNGRFELAKGAASYYVNINGSQTFKPALQEVLYWSLSVNLGISAKPAALLAP